MNKHCSDIGPCASSLAPGEVYNSDATLPPGFANPCNICYANSVLQCLFNHRSFRGLYTELKDQHCIDCRDVSLVLNEIQLSSIMIGVSSIKIEIVQGNIKHYYEKNNISSQNQKFPT